MEHKSEAVAARRRRTPDRNRERVPVWAASRPGDDVTMRRMETRQNARPSTVMQSDNI